MKRFIGTICVGVALIAVGSGDALAQSSGCMVQQAASAAMQRRLAEIDAAKTNVDDFFNGAKSCIGSGLLDQLDYSNLIPDPSGILSGGFQKLGQQLLDQAKKQACQIVQYQIQGVVDRMNSEVGSYSSGIGGNLSSILGQQQSIQVPSIAGFGSYNITSPTASQVIQGTTGVNPSVYQSQTPVLNYQSSGSSSNLSEMFH